MKHYCYICILLLGFVSCTNDSEQLVQQSGESSLCLVTRAGASSDSDDLALKVLDSEGRLYRQYAAGAIPQKVVLEPGIFTIVLYTENQETWPAANGGRGEPCYYIEKQVQLNFDQMIRDTVTVPMVNYAVSLKLPEYFHDLFNSHTFALTSGGRNTTIQEGEKAYFAPSDRGFSYALQATNTDGVTHSHSAYKFADVQSGKLYVVTYVYGLDSNTGGVDIEIKDDMQMEDTDVEI
jgi:hypothetical protein